jgi:hypothetical protein
MKNNGKILSGALFLLLLAGVVVPGSAQIYTLNNANASLIVDATVGVTGYYVDGVNQVKSQWFYYRIGDGGAESAINTIGSPVLGPGDARTLDLTYGNGQYSARVVYSLTGGSSGTGNSSLNQTLTFLNSSASPLALRFFDYSDFDLKGGAGGPQSLNFTTTSVGGFRTNGFTQTAGAATVTSRLVSGGTAPSHIEAALYNQTLASLGNGTSTTLNDIMGPVSGDVTGTFEWDVTVPAGSSLSISKVTSLQAVPEPTAAGLVAMGLVAMLYRRRRI